MTIRAELDDLLPLFRTQHFFRLSHDSRPCHLCKLRILGRVLRSAPGKDDAQNETAVTEGSGIQQPAKMKLPCHLPEFPSLMIPVTPQVQGPTVVTRASPILPAS